MLYTLFKSRSCETQLVEYIPWLKLLIKQETTMIIEGEKSTYVPVESGVHQGSVFNLSLFLYYINDILVGLNSTIRSRLVFVTHLYIWLWYPLIICNKMSTKLQHGNKMENAFSSRQMSVTRNKSTIKIRCTFHCRPVESLDQTILV